MPNPLILPAQDQSGTPTPTRLELWTVADVLKPRACSIDQEQSTAGLWLIAVFQMNEGSDEYKLSPYP